MNRMNIIMWDYFEKGVRRGSDIDQSLLESLVVLFQKPSIRKLKQDILSDLKHCTHVVSIGGGSFVNKFKFDFENLTQDQAKQCLLRIKQHHPKFARYIQSVRDLPEDRAFYEISTRAGSKDRGKLMEDLRIYSAIQSFESYLNDENEIILDTYLTPILNSISQMKDNQTLGTSYKGLSVVTFEGNLDDVRLSIPIGGYPNQCQCMCLLYKEQDESKFMNLFYIADIESHRGLIRMYTDAFQDQNDSMALILKTIQDLINSNQTEVSNEDYMDVQSCFTNKTTGIVN